jgi:phosphate transport system substrate-binding protein
VDIPCTDPLPEVGDEWTRGFRKYHPESNLIFRYKPSRDAVKELLEGSAPLVILARELSSAEMKAFRDKYGYMPMRMPVGMDANIVFVNKANPLTSITMAQLDAIYSKTRKGGAKEPAVVWGDLGIRGELAKRRIDAFSRPEGSAVRASFGALALMQGEFRDGIQERDDYPSLAESVTTDAASIGYGPLICWYSTNKILPVVPYDGTEARYPTQEMVTSSRYPMTRLFYAYLNRAPGDAVPKPINEVLHLILTQEGQNEVADGGLLPAPVEYLTIALKRLSR